jgi:uncharacterized protein YcbK (DUF882 family)
LNRRSFLKLSCGVSAGLVATPLLASVAPRLDERALAFYNTHTGERVTTTYWADGEYLATELTAINRVLRDHRSGQVHAIDQRLFDILFDLQRVTGARGEFHVISGYRSPASNAALRRHSNGVAKASLHTLGKAIDIRLPGYDLNDLRRAALSLRAGGVGYYPASEFIHLDTGRVRTW